MYAKVFEQIFDSSIAEDWKTRLVFEDLLVMADQNGVVDKTHEAISRRTNVPIDIVRESIMKLEHPDPNSRSQENEGRRIVLLDEHRNWGWMIVNYEHYRKLATEEQRREKTLIRVKKHRALHGVTETLPYAYASSCASDFEELWKSYPSKTGSKEKAFAAWQKWSKAGDTKELALDGIKRYVAHVDASRNGGFTDLKYQNGQTFFNGRGWASEWSIDTKPMSLHTKRGGFGGVDCNER